MNQAVGFKDVHIFVSLTSISLVMLEVATSLRLLPVAWPGTMYMGTFLVGLGYGAQRGIVLAAVSELFGAKHFGAMYSFLTVVNPRGSLIFSGLIASNLYDYEAEKQAHHHQSSALLSPTLLHNMGFLANGPLKCEGAVCFLVSSLIMSAFCVVGAGLSLIVVHRTKRFCAQPYHSVRT
uniref:Nodulin-like domain-containing protein n=1 Tax=Arundo donax TaxID=35708 RepID=A0A0A9CW63_ARUDO